MAICGDLAVAANHKYSVVHWIKASSIASGILELLQRMNKKELVVLAIQNQGAAVTINTIKEEIPYTGIKLLDVQYFNPGERDFRMILTRIREEHPDVLVPLAFSPEMEIILRQSRQIGLNVPMPSESYDIIADKSLGEGQYNVSCSRGTPKFREYIQSAINHDTDYAVPFLYDSLDFIRAAYEASSKIDHAVAAEYLSHLKDYPSAAGPVSTDENRFIDSPATYYKIEHGQIVPVTLDEIK